VLSATDALKIAREEGLDLVMISEKADPPVCKILDYKKFLYDQKKKQKGCSKRDTFWTKH
jgi:translation initiation factor IF-3